jgi:hypothetical protein
MTQRLPLSQGKSNIAQSFSIQLAVEQRPIGSWVKGVSIALFFLAIIYLALCCSKSKTSLRICIVGLIRLACGSLRSLLCAPDPHRRTYPVAQEQQGTDHGFFYSLNNSLVPSS